MMEMDKNAYHIISSIRTGWNVIMGGKFRRHFKSRDEAISWCIVKGFNPLYVHNIDGSVKYKMSISKG